MTYVPRQINKPNKLPFPKKITSKSPTRKVHQKYMPSKASATI